MIKRYPKVLIINPYLLEDISNETSITLNSYFGEWPKDKIAQIITLQFTMQNSGVSQKYKNTYILNNNDIILLRHLFKVKRIPRLKSPAEKSSVNSKNLASRIKLSLKNSLIAFSGFFKYNVSNDLMSFIESFSPEIIYYLPNGYRMFKLVNDINKELNLKTLPHFMDDWPATIYNKPSTKIQRLFMLYYIKKSLSRVSVCLCISEYMCKEYEKRYNIGKCHPLMNCVNRFYGNGQNNFSNKVIKIAYLGGINNLRADVIERIYNIIEDSNFPPFELVIHTSMEMWKNNQSRYSRYPNIKYGGYLDRSEVLEKILNYDILLHVESFDRTMRRYTRFSMSSKIPEYLSTGNIILAVGPSEIASIKYLKENNAAITITDLNDNQLIQQRINELLDVSFRGKVLENGKDLFINNHLKQNQILLPLLLDLLKD